jgi:uncharacterized peroxidase-related enzyme
MAHISLPSGIPGIVGPMMLYPETERPLNALAEVLLRGESSLSSADRELIAAYVSARNECVFCSRAHAAVSRHLYGTDRRALVDQVLADPDSAPIDEKLRALLAIAGKVQKGGLEVRPEDIERARGAGADDKAIHDTVLIAAAFCMFNRYVDGLATWTPEEPAIYDRIGEDLATRGYGKSIRRGDPEDHSPALAGRGPE